jgi:hypothetical protein
MTMRDQTYTGGDARAVGRDAHDERERDLEGMRPVNAGRPVGEPAAMTDGGAGPRDRSIADLLKELRDESSALLRQEVALAKTEMAEKAAEYGKNTASIAVGGAVAYSGVLLLLAGLTVALALILDAVGMDEHAWWIAPLIVGGIVAAIGYAMINKGTAAIKQQSPVPQKTVQSLQEDKQWLKDKVS